MTAYSWRRWWVRGNRVQEVRLVNRSVPQSGALYRAVMVLPERAGKEQDYASRDDLYEYEQEAVRAAALRALSGRYR